jgi:DnaJ-class molecular chaperone
MTSILITCPECSGDGTMEFEFPVPMSFSNPHGYMDTRIEPCDNCKGDGEIEGWDDDE